MLCDHLTDLKVLGSLTAHADAVEQGEAVEASALVRSVVCQFVIDSDVGKSKVCSHCCGSSRVTHPHLAVEHSGTNGHTSVEQRNRVKHAAIL